MSKFGRRRLLSQGVTLVECMVAMVIMTIGLLAAYLTYYQSTRMVQSTWNTSRVNSAIRQEMEEVRTWNWDAINNLTSAGFTNAVLNDVPDAVGTVAAEYYPVATNTALTIKKVTIYVDWTDLNGVPREDTATTLICKDGLNTAGLETQ